MELKEVGIEQIIPYENNPRRNDDAVDAVAESIRQCGYCAPIVVDENMVILAGHTRLKALRQLGWMQVKVCVIAGLTEDQKRKYRLLDNKTNELASWDFDLLEQELDGLDFEGFDFGFIDEVPVELDAEEDYEANASCAVKISFANYTALSEWEEELKNIAVKAGATYAVVK